MIDLKDKSNYPVLALMMANLLLCGLILFGSDLVVIISVIIFIAELLLGGIFAILIVLNNIR